MPYHKAGPDGVAVEKFWVDKTAVLCSLCSVVLLTCGEFVAHDSLGFKCVQVLQIIPQILGFFMPGFASGFTCPFRQMLFRGKHGAL